MVFSRSTRDLLSLSLFGALTVAGCDTQDGFDDELSEGDVELRIEVALDDIDDSDPIRNAVALLGGGCTATLVAPDIVLTAAHCGFDNPAFYTGGWTPLPSPTTVAFGPSRASPLLTITANQVSAPPLHTGGAHPEWLDDIVLLRLTSNVPPTIAVPRPVYLDRPRPLDPNYGSASETIYQVGYGGGRNRRMMTGSNYRDWLTHPSVSPTDQHNIFEYEADIAGLGIGDRATNIEGGDSGGPMLLNDPEGFVFGVLSHWAPTGLATFGPGTDGRSPIRAWLTDLLPPQRPDFEVVGVTEGGCTGTGGHPKVAVTIRNNGVVADSCWVDVFTGLAEPPTVGQYSPIYRSSGVLAPAEEKTLWFTIDSGFASGWVDAVLDTTRSVPELDEENNVGWGHVVLPDCSFG